jgi:hypothetical protein
MKPAIHAAFIASLLAATACGASTQKPAIETVMKDSALRSESFEATLRVLDEHPAYVDEFFALALRHQPTLERFTENAASAADQDRIARMMARHLAAHPASLKLVLIATLDAVAGDPEGKTAAAEAMAARPMVGAMILGSSPEAVTSNVRELLKEVHRNASARRAFLSAMQENSPELAQLVLKNPPVLEALLKAMAQVGVAKGEKELRAFLAASGVSDSE